MAYCKASGRVQSAAAKMAAYRGINFCGLRILSPVMNMLSDKVSAALTGLVSGLCNGLFGSGGGTVLVPCMEKFLKTEEHRAHSTAIAVILPLCVLSGAIYFYGAHIPLRETAFACAGGAAGGYCGARLLGKIKGRSLHIIFGIFMLIGGVRMII